jgi:hypothetical protein
LKNEYAPSFGVEEPSAVHEDDLRQVLATLVIFPVERSEVIQQVELMLYAFDGSPSLDKVAYLCPGATLFRIHVACCVIVCPAGNLRVRALRRFIKASLAQSGHVVSKVRFVL